MLVTHRRGLGVGGAVSGPWCPYLVLGHTNTHSFCFPGGVITVPIIIHAGQERSHADRHLETRTHTQPCAHQPQFELLLLSWPRSAPYSAGQQQRLTLFLFCHAKRHELPFLLSLGPKRSTRVRLFKSSYAVNLPFIAHQVKHQLLCVLVWFELEAC